MSMSPKTLPKVRMWVQCDVTEMRSALNSLVNGGVKITKEKVSNQDIYCHGDNIVARHYSYQKSEQCMVHVSVREHLPDRRHVNETEMSIYMA